LLPKFVVLGKAVKGVCDVGAHAEVIFASGEVVAKDGLKEHTFLAFEGIDQLEDPEQITGVMGRLF
jgi:hypothetical protein